MKKTMAVIMLLLLGSISLSADDLIDVVKMRDGSVYKGIIIENKINEYVLIELADGSQLKFQYADIEIISREKGPLASTAASSDQENKEPPIKHFTGYYTFRGEQYPRDGSGYIGLVNAIESNITPSQDFAKIISDYRSYVSTTKMFLWGGAIICIGGGVWLFYSVFLNSLLSPLPKGESTFDVFGPALVMSGGAIIGIIGIGRSGKEPVELVNYYNTNYGK